MKKLSAVILSTILLLSFSTIASADYIRDEKESLRIKHEAKMRKCAKLKSTKRSSCVTKNKANYKSKLSLLKENPDAYFGAGSRGSSSGTSKYSSSSSYQNDPGPCIGDCGSEQGICISNCRGNGTCISNCSSAHGRCVARCSR